MKKQIEDVYLRLYNEFNLALSREKGLDAREKVTFELPQSLMQFFGGLLEAIFERIEVNKKTINYFLL